MGDNQVPHAPPTDAVLDASYETIVLTLDLVGTEISKIPSQLTQAVQDLKFQQEVENFLNEYAKKLLQQKSTGNALAPADAGKIALTIAQAQGKKMGQKIGTDILDQIENSSKVAELKAKLQELGKDITDQPVGVWFTDSKAYIIATGLLINGVALVFATSYGVRKVGMPAILSALEGQTLKVKPFGSLELGTGIAKVDRTSGVVDLKITGTQDWKSIKVTIDVVGHSSIKDLSRVQGGAVETTVSVPVNKNVALGFKGSVDKPKSDQKSIIYDLEADLKISPDKGSYSLGISAFVKGDGAKRPDFGGTLDFTYHFW
jgi:hypothetical protein